MNGRRIVALALVLALLFTSLMPQSVSAQDIPLRDDQSPIIELCKLLWEQSQQLFIVTCGWIMLLPFAYAPVSNVVPDPPPPTPVPTPTPPSFVNFDQDGDALTIQEECPENECDEYAYIVFAFEEMSAERQCLEPYSSTLMYSDDNETFFPKSRHYISLQPRSDSFGYIAKVRRFTNSSNWAQAWHYNLAVWCLE